MMLLLDYIVYDIKEHLPFLFFFLRRLSVILLFLIFLLSDGFRTTVGELSGRLEGYVGGWDGVREVAVMESISCTI